ncbi:MAG: RnfABCDGE type electron transport complex subunit D [Ruminococcus sp.]|nr:RnfABCDGE type electron transport complex subunit D [Ruminococcus sp.]
MLKRSRPEKSVLSDILLTLVTLETMAYFYYGTRALALAGVCAGCSLAAEIISLRLMGRSFRIQDAGCIADGLIISLMIPAVTDFRIAGTAAIFAVIIKNVLGGRFNMIFSRAAVAYVFMLTSWENEIMRFTEPHVRTAVAEVPEKLIDSASHIYNLTGKFDYTDLEILWGNFAGASGMTSILLLAVSAVILILRRDISAGAFIGTVAGTVIFAVITSTSVTYSIVTNAVLFTAIYIIADRRVAPVNDFYAFFYGIFIAMFSFIIVLTTAKENAIIIISVLFTPVALGFRNLEHTIDIAREEAENVGQQ